MRDVAAELLDVYAKREIKPGFKFHANQPKSKNKSYKT
ncbi:transcription-repair coupling factor [Vibrio cholerae]|nr:transcription-repair coupling factor [Vibrio cholerae]